jgi:hypothetical protein
MQNNSGKVWGAAILRGVYNAVGTGAVTFLVLWASVGLKAACIAGGIAALGALGFRGGGEGYVDAGRAAANDVKPSDVGAFSLPIGTKERDQP